MKDEFQQDIHQMFQESLRMSHLASILALSLWAFFFLNSCVCADSPENSAPRPAHHTKEGFINPYMEPRKKGFLDYYKMRYFGDEKFADYGSNAHKVPVTAPDLDLVRSPGPSLQVTWIGHATMLIQYDGVSVITDPIFSQRASPVIFAGPKRYHPPALQISELPEPDLAVISHSHYDHLDKASVRQLGDRVDWLVPLGLKKWFVENGIREDKVFEFDWWQSRVINGVEVTATPVQHWSARSWWDKNETLWASWMIRIGDKTVWYSGDTGYNPYQFKEIGRKFNRVDLALISIGAYAPRWFMKEVHIDPEEAVIIHKEINAVQSLGIQWGTFQLTAEPIDEPPRKLAEAVKKHDLSAESFITTKIGETYVLPRNGTPAE